MSLFFLDPEQTVETGTILTAHVCEMDHPVIVGLLGFRGGD